MLDAGNCKAADVAERIHDDEPDTSESVARALLAAGAAPEVAVLQHIERAQIASIVATPLVRHVGQPHEVFPFHWSILDWIDGADAWTMRDDLASRSLGPLASYPGRAVTAIGQIKGIDVPRRSPGSRGGALQPLLDRLHGWWKDSNTLSAVFCTTRPADTNSATS